MKTTLFLLFLLILNLQQVSFAQTNYPSPVRPGNEAIAPGKFEPTWQSLLPAEDVIIKTLGKLKNEGKI